MTKRPRRRWSSGRRSTVSRSSTPRSRRRRSPSRRNGCSRRSAPPGSTSSRCTPGCGPGGRTGSRSRTWWSRVRDIDVRHLGVPRVICCHVLDDVIVDPGPESTLGTLLAELGDFVPRSILLTHIHLDHAGAAGALAQRWPDVEVWVHERGARHMADPSKLLASAERLYGDDMERLWGEFLPVPAQRIRTVGDERLGDFTVAKTPGHASHHVSYLHHPTGTAFTGDTTGARVAGGPVIGPTPPPDID